jgi:hypothetical protein
MVPVCPRTRTHTYRQTDRQTDRQSSLPRQCDPSPHPFHPSMHPSIRPTDRGARTTGERSFASVGRLRLRSTPSPRLRRRRRRRHRSLSSQLVAREQRGEISARAAEKGKSCHGDEGRKKIETIGDPRYLPCVPFQQCSDWKSNTSAHTRKRIEHRRRFCPTSEPPGWRKVRIAFSRNSRRPLGERKCLAYLRCC